MTTIAERMALVPAYLVALRLLASMKPPAVARARCSIHACTMRPDGSCCLDCPAGEHCPRNEECQYRREGCRTCGWQERGKA